MRAPVSVARAISSGVAALWPIKAIAPGDMADVILGTWMLGCQRHKPDQPGGRGLPAVQFGGVGRADVIQRMRAARLVQRRDRRPLGMDPDDHRRDQRMSGTGLRDRRASRGRAGDHRGQKTRDAGGGKVPAQAQRRVRATGAPLKSVPR
ncbi:hypothetical protein [Pseudogemmobacter sonorensis]|uniref:hypothetical protein n=1 Tax=Pseudogemmobacter sonorensis TaxID=2989681 RepID=UPI0036C02A6E